MNRYHFFFFASLLATATAWAINQGLIPATDDPIRQVVVETLDAKGHEECTATRIAQDTYMTASHCFEKGASRSVMVNGKKVAILSKDIIRNNKFSEREQSADNDVAIFKTVHAAGPQVSAKLGTSASTPKAGRYLSIAGYGDTTGHDNDSRGLHITYGSLDRSAGPGSIDIDTKVNRKTNGRSQIHTSGVCDGDSGGPAYTTQNNTVIVWGIVSGPPGPRAILPGTHQNCSVDTQFSSVVADDPWLNQNLAKLNPPAAHPVAVASQPQPTVVPTPTAPRQPASVPPPPPTASAPVQEALTVPGWSTSAEVWLQETGAVQ